jgi:hypothetical protein
MKTTGLVLLSLAVAFCLVFTSAVKAEEAATLGVEDAVICKDVVDRTPVEAGVRFQVSAGKLYCFTRITGAQEPATITHVWYFDDAKWASISLSIGSASWRTFSSKVIQPHQVGSWHVDVIGPDGELLKKIEFEVQP